jgi:GSCFA family
VFRTEISIPPSPLRISHQSDIFTIGSCFSDVIGEKLVRNKFSVLANPFGVAFNPESIFTLLNECLDKNEFSKNGYIESHKIWHNYYFHSELYGTTLEELSEKINTQKKLAHVFLLKAKILTITFGTAYVYRLKSNRQIVSNCHKMPSELFTRELLSVDDIIKSFDQFYKKAILANPGLKIVLTVSPVRHIKDSIPLNNVSKSILRLASHTIAAANDAVSYFPAYEIMMDDLRDYRFYKEDMIHPTEVAEKYIWEKFTDTYLENQSKEFIREWAGVLKALEHKPFHPESESHQNFIRETIRKIKSLSAYANLSDELNMLESQLK